MGTPVQVSKRDVDVLTWVSDGLRYKEIAFKLSCSQPALTQRMRRIMLRFKTRNTAQTVAYAIRNGIIP